ncbi:2TM domain-containing protein [Romeria aff. gracilis LEGE 07310]|uniref:2TM domain-containing protein n=1 Tax=Vasconcelosia minhoensis LEGE 07310 TaxID=915328 RepID=A0A8J7AT22_9CYAN|nr:2TM domain-containing protein [Romeria gracilis]MBE9079920.1 2TM domain-containing protein [Romeria aff. gracilis LEGE 07310]
MTELYASEDAQQILQIAIAKETESGELSRSQLVEIAAELGIASETLFSAEREWLSLKGEAAEQFVFNQQRKQKFQHHLVRYGIVNGFLLLLNLLTPIGWLWSLTLFVFIVWSMILALHGWKAYQLSGYRYQTEFENWRRRQRVKQSVNKFVNRLLGA